MSRTCSTCIHWAAPDPPDDVCWRHDDDEFVAGEGGYCALCISEGWGVNFGRCRMTASDDGRAEIPSTLAVAIDAETYGATLRTHPAFNCSMWASRAVVDALVVAERKVALGAARPFPTQEAGQ